jgi:hypothetical protein
VELAPAAIVAPDLDLAFPIRLGPGALIVPRAGGSALVFGGGVWGGLIAGGNAGAGLVFGAASPVSFRADTTIRRCMSSELDDDGPMHTMTLGVSWRSGR